MIGELTGRDNRTVIIVDTDGYLNGHLDKDDKLSFCYTHAGGKSQTSVISCTEVKRAK
jgi:Mg-chelatase subunit ChlD